MMGKKLNRRVLMKMFSSDKGRGCCATKVEALNVIFVYSIFFTPKKYCCHILVRLTFNFVAFLRVVELEPQFQVLGETIKNAAACCVATDSAGLASPSWAESHLSTGGLISDL